MHNFNNDNALLRDETFINFSANFQFDLSTGLNDIRLKEEIKRWILIFSAYKKNFSASRIHTFNKNWSNCRLNWLYGIKHKAFVKSEVILWSFWNFFKMLIWERWRIVEKDISSMNRVGLWSSQVLKNEHILFPSRMSWVIVEIFL